MQLSMPIIAATTAAVATQRVVALGGNFPAVTIGADNLVGAETVVIYVRIGETWKAVTDFAGTPVILNSTISAVVLEGGPEYGVTKSATAGACAVLAIASTRNY